MNDFFLMRKNLFRKKLRASLLLTSIAIAFLIFAVLMAFQSAFYRGDDIASQTRLMTMNKINFTQPVPISYVNRILTVKGVKNATPFAWFGGYYREAKNGLIMFAVQPESFLQTYSDTVAISGNLDDFAKDRRALLVGKATADKFHLKVGQHIPISSNIYSNKAGGHSWDFVIAAIYINKKLGDATANVFMQYDYFNDSITFGKDHANFIAVTTASPAVNERVMHSIDNMFANSEAETSTGTEAAFNRSFVEQMGNIKLIIGLVVGAAFVTILMIVGNTMVMAVRERTKEIGVFKTLGFSESRILKLVLGESMVLACLGGMIGIVLATLIVAVLAKVAAGFFPGLAIPVSAYLEAIGIMILLGLVTGLAPAISAMRLNIVTALGRR